MQCAIDSKEEKTRIVDLQLGKLRSWITSRQHAVRHADSLK
jgi:hypothetical protein